MITGFLKSTGFVGYGTVVTQPTSCRDFISPVTHTRLIELELSNPSVLHDLEDLDRCEWMVGIRRIKTFPREEDENVPWYFHERNIACRLNDPRTVVFLSEQFEVEKT